MPLYMPLTFVHTARRWLRVRMNRARARLLLQDHGDGSGQEGPPPHCEEAFIGNVSCHSGSGTRRQQQPLKQAGSCLTGRSPREPLFCIATDRAISSAERPTRSVHYYCIVHLFPAGGRAHVDVRTYIYAPVVDNRLKHMMYIALILAPGF